MFDYKQDTGLLHYALESAASALRSDKNSKNLCDIEDVKAAVKLVSSTVKKILALNLHGLQDEMEIIKTQLHINRRLHAVLFYAALRSYGIVSVEADTFYSSVCYVFPALDWKFYIELNMQCHWSEYFIECAQQLPCNVLAVVLKKVLEVSREESVKYYAWHLVLQSALQKFVILEGGLSSEIQWPFHFSFTCVPSSNASANSQALPDSCDSSSSDSESDFEQLPDLYKRVILFISVECASKCNNVDFANVIFHALKTVFKFLPLIKKCTELLLKEFYVLYELFHHCILLDLTQKSIGQSMNTYVQPVVSHIYATSSWGISESYLTFILYHSWNNLIQKYSARKSVEGESPSVEESFKDVLDAQLFKLLHKLNPLFQDFKNIENMELHIYLLTKMIQCQHPYASRAAEIILMDPTLLERNDVLSILEERSCILDISQMHPLFINAVIKMESNEKRIRLLELFFKMLSEAPSEIYNDVLKNILVSRCCNKFELPDITDQLSVISRKVLSFQEAQQILPPLFIQSPKLVLENVIAQALLQGDDGKTLIQVLKVVPATCKFQSSDKDIPLLVQELKNYMEKDELEPFESKNMVFLFKHLMNVQSEKSILELDCLLSECFIPGLCFENKNTDIYLECLNATLKILLRKRVLQMNDQNLISLVKCLAEILNNCINFGFGKYKENAITAISLLEEYSKYGPIDDKCRENLKYVFSLLNPATALYASDLLQKKIETPNLPYKLLFIWCCIKKDTSAFEDRIKDDNLSYANLLSIIIQLLGHSTIDEWLHLASLIRIYFKYAVKDKTVSATDVPWRLSESNSQLYEVIRCFIESLHFLLWENGGDMSYISDCFSNTLKSLLKEEPQLDPEFLLKVFLDVCYLISRIRSDLILMFTSILIDLNNNMIVSCTDEISKSDCCRISLLALNNLPNFPEKERFLKKMVC